MNLYLSLLVSRWDRPQRETQILEQREKNKTNQWSPDLEKNTEKFNTISAVSWFERDYYKIWTKLVEVMEFQLSYFKT